MSGSIVIEVGGPIGSAAVVGGEGEFGGQECAQAEEMSERVRAELESERARLRGVCETLQQAAEKLKEMYERGISEQRAGIAKLAVEIAARIVRRKTEEGDYEIVKTVEEAMKEAGAEEDVTIHLNPRDMEQCKKAQASGEVKFSGVTFVADAGVGRAECRVETKRGIIASVIDEQLERVGKALIRAVQSNDNE
jgi:flagellar biosynthesis/type III secretory pathway protein FliH